MIYFCAETEHHDVTLGQVLSFCTGSEYPPPLGFDRQITIRFTASSDFPLASTCALELTVPSKFFNDVETFKQKLVYGLLNHGGFGML